MKRVMNTAFGQWKGACLSLPLVLAQWVTGCTVAPGVTPLACHDQVADGLSEEYLLDHLKGATEGIRSAYGRGDWEALLFPFAFEAITLPPDASALVGRGALHTQLLDLRERGVQINRITLLDQQLWSCGRFLYQEGLYEVVHSPPGRAGAVRNHYGGLIVRECQSDGVLRIKLCAYNRIDNASHPQEARGPRRTGRVESCAGPAGEGLSQDYLFEEILGIEEAFFNFIVEAQVERVLGCYAKDATVMITGQPAARGKEAVQGTLREYIQGGPPRTGIVQEILQLEGDERMVYVVSQVQWTKRDPATGHGFMGSGKSVHLWQRQDDYTWKLLVDVYNDDR